MAPIGGLHPLHRPATTHLQKAAIILIACSCAMTRGAHLGGQDSSWRDRSLKPGFFQNLAFPDPGIPDVPHPDWMDRYSSRKLGELYLPGTHDSGTYSWTVPSHLPFILDGIAAMIFSIVEDLSSTQRLTIYEQLQAGARVLDLRLAINPWIAVEARGLLSSPQLGSSLVSFDMNTMAATLNMTAAGGPLTLAELPYALVLSHSLPAVRLRAALHDLRRFLKEQPTEVVVVMVKADSVDVNAAGIHRMTDHAWAAAAQVVQEEMAGVQLLTQEQVEQQTLGELQAGASMGSVLLYSSDLRDHGVAAVCNQQLEIVESWGNGTNTEDVPQLVDRLVHWMEFWHQAGWHPNMHQSRKPNYLLLASAEITLGVKSILELIKNRVWLAQQPLLQGVADAKVLTLYAMGVQANQQLLQQVLRNSEVVKSFNIWSVDALSSDIVSFIIGLNEGLPPSPSSILRHRTLRGVGIRG